MFLSNIKVKEFNLSSYNPQAIILGCLTLLSSFALLAVTFYDCFSLSAPQFGVVFITLIISGLTGQYRLQIPKTKIKIKFQEVVIFWTVIWLGVSAGVLAAAVASVVCFISASKDKKGELFKTAVNIFTAFIAGNAFYFFLKYAAGFTGNVAADNALAFVWLAVAAVIMASTRYFLSTILNSFFAQTEDSVPLFQIGRENFFWTAANYSVCILAVFTAHFAFLKFGLSFGLVILPLAFISHLAYRIHVARLAQKTKEIYEASRVHLATVEALATAIDARDQVGIGHVRRTQIYAVGIGKVLDLTENELQALNTGALLHDIGKLAVPDHILNKPGRLTPAELEKTKIHASVGASILEKVNFSYPVVPTVKYHHEMWDGSGYPKGLSKENIPLTARILSVADAYDTLRGARPYRPAVSREDARKFLVNGAGTQFDPKIVDLFLRNLRRLEDEIDEQGFSYNLDSESSLQNFYDDDDRNYVEQIKRANREVFTLYELARVFSSSLNLADTLSLFVKKIGELVPFDSCVVYLSEADGEFAKAAYAFGENSAVLSEKRVKAGEGATGFVLKKRQPVSDIDPGLDFTFHQTELVQEYAGMVSLPLVADEKLIGAVSLYSYQIEAYEEEHLRLLEAISLIASDAVWTALQHAETESRALTDPMTNLPNARSLQIQFEKEVARARRGETNFHLLMLDLDGFKAVNDTFGHKAGDKLLKEVSKVMRGQLRDYDFLARYAGDEFVIIVPETCKENVQELCRRIEKAVYDFTLPIDGGESFARVGISLGAACYPYQGETLDEIIVVADKAMYAAKTSRREKTKQFHKSQASVNVEAPVKLIEESFRDGFIVELDESHIISSSAIN